MVSVQITFLEDPKPGKGFEYIHVPGPKLAMARVPCPEEEVTIPDVGEALGGGKLYRVIFVRHLAERIPTFNYERDEWPARAEIGVIPG